MHIAYFHLNSISALMSNVVFVNMDTLPTLGVCSVENKTNKVLLSMQCEN